MQTVIVISKESSLGVEIGRDGLILGLFEFFISIFKFELLPLELSPLSLSFTGMNCRVAEFQLRYNLNITGDIY